MRKIKSVFAISILAAFLGFGIASAQNDFLIWDLDGNKNSGPEIRIALNAKGYVGVYDSTLTPYIGNLSTYCSIYICLGVFPNAVFLGSFPAEVDSLVAYLQNGGNIYMEGAETWFFDPPTTLHSFFNIAGLARGSGDADSVLGQTATFTAGMAFDYSGNNAFMDHIGALSSAFVIFANSSPAYNNGIAYDDGGGSYRTVGTSYEFGGLDNGAPPSTKADLADSLMHFFGCFRTVFEWDVSVISLNRPEQMTPQNSTVAPQVTVKNLGDSTASFDVTCSINGYTNTQAVFNLAPDDTQRVNFLNWTSGNCGSIETMTAYTQLATDQRASNDTLSRTVTAWDDRWTIFSSCTSTPPTIDGIINPVEWQDATVREVGDFLGKAGGPFPCGTAVLYVMNDDSMVYFALDAPWDLAELDDDVFVLYFEDNHDNAWPPFPDSTEGELQFIHNVPPSTPNFFFRPIMDDSSNFLFPVAMDGFSSIPSGNMQYELALPLDLINENLNAAAGDTVGMWLSASDRDSMTVYGWWPTSSNLGNGALADMGDLILCPSTAINDGGVVSIDAPLSPVCTDSIQQVCVTVQNYGNRTETFDVTYIVDGDTAVQQVSNLNPGNSVQVCFDSLWTVPSPDSTWYVMTVCTSVPNDTIPSNDCQSDSIFAFDCSGVIRDGTVLSINSPPDTVCTDSTYQVCVTVQNLGNITETFDVMYVVNGDTGVQTVINLDPDSTFQFCFSSLWMVPPDSNILYGLTVCTQVPGDINPINDCDIQTIFAIICPPVGVEEGREFALPTVFGLRGGTPNPFHQTSEIHYQIPAPGGEISLKVYDITGKRVRTLVDGKKEAGYYKIDWDGRNERGEELASGVYFYRLTAGREEFKATRKLILMR